MLAFLVSALVGFLATVLVIPKLIVILRNIDVVGYDIHKKSRPAVAEIGGLPVLIGFLAGILTYVATRTFLGAELSVTAQLLAAALTMTIIVLIGMLDDLTTLLGRKKGGATLKAIKRTGFKQTTKFLLPIPAAVPLMVTNTGVSSITLPFLGSVNVGLAYPLLLIPLGIFGASNATNMLAGMNGLTAGLGTVLLTSLGLYAFASGATTAAAIALIFVSVLFGFLIFNWYPARMFPGDSLDYAIGAAAATVAIIGNIERFAVFAFIPWFIELVLKARSRFRAESFGILQEDGTLKAPYEKSYSLTHIVMKAGRFTEKQVVLALIGFEALVCIFAFAMFL